MFVFSDLDGAAELTNMMRKTYKFLPKIKVATPGLKNESQFFKRTFSDDSKMFEIQRSQSEHHEEYRPKLKQKKSSSPHKLYLKKSKS